MTFDETQLVAAQKHASGHRAEILRSQRCACFHCLCTFSPGQIASWTDDGNTAICARCPVDSVIGDASGYPVTNPEFLHAMHAFWFDS